MVEVIVRVPVSELAIFQAPDQPVQSLPRFPLLAAVRPRVTGPAILASKSCSAWRRSLVGFAPFLVGFDALLLGPVAALHRQ